MKNIVLFISALIIGIFLISAYMVFLRAKNTMEILGIPIITTHFSLAEAPTNAIQGSIISQEGSIDWQSRIANNLTRLPIQTTIQQGEKISTESNANIILQFSSVATLHISQNTVVNFIQTLPVNMVIEQDSGVASYTSTGISPISIRSFDLVTTLRTGTATVSIDKKTNSVTVDVQKGVAIAGFNNAQDVSNVISISTGKQYVFNNDTKQGNIQ